MTKSEIKTLKEIEEYGNDGAYEAHFKPAIINALKQKSCIVAKSLEPNVSMEFTKVVLTELGTKILEQINTTLTASTDGHK